MGIDKMAPFQFHNLIFIFFTIAVYFASSTNAACSSPTTPSGASYEVHLHGEERSSFPQGDHAVYRCSSDDGGYGYMTLLCDVGDSWSLPDRQCGDPVAFDNGSLIGIVGTSISLLLVGFVVFFTKGRADPLSDCESEDIVVEETVA